jgi:hypothetical protein
MPYIYRKVDVNKQQVAIKNHMMKMSSELAMLDKKALIN